MAEDTRVVFLCLLIDLVQLRVTAKLENCLPPQKLKEFFKKIPEHKQKRRVYGEFLKYLYVFNVSFFSLFQSYPSQSKKIQINDASSFLTQ